MNSNEAQDKAKMRVKVDKDEDDDEDGVQVEGWLVMLSNAIEASN